MLFLGLTVPTVFAQDATIASPEHYKVEFENDQVRIVRITYAPGEESPMHEHGDAVVVYLTDLLVQFTLADGTTPAPATAAAGAVAWMPAEKHAAKNLSDHAIEALMIEIKN
jgi:quercetin dioxygenase-like cupin family protein